MLVKIVAPLFDFKLYDRSYLSVSLTYNYLVTYIEYKGLLTYIYIREKLC